MRKLGWLTRHFSRRESGYAAVRPSRKQHERYGRVQVRNGLCIRLEARKKVDIRQSLIRVLSGRKPSPIRVPAEGNPSKIRVLTERKPSRMRVDYAKKAALTGV